MHQADFHRRPGNELRKCHLQRCWGRCRRCCGSQSSTWNLLRRSVRIGHDDKRCYLRHTCGQRQCFDDRTHDQPSRQGRQFHRAHGLTRNRRRNDCHGRRFQLRCIEVEQRHHLRVARGTQRRWGLGGAGFEQQLTRRRAGCTVRQPNDGHGCQRSVWQNSLFRHR